MIRIHKNHHCQPASRCPQCGHHLSSLTSATDPDLVPDAGSVSLCVFCGALLVLTAALEHRFPTPEEMDAIRASEDWPLVEQMQRVIRNAHGASFVGVATLHPDDPRTN